VHHSDREATSCLYVINFTFNTHKLDTCDYHKFIAIALLIRLYVAIVLF
jgi:hypothetical protein